MAEAAAAGGMALKMVGSIQQGNANAGIADYNANIADQNADIALKQGAEQARRSLVLSNKTIGAEAASYGASGVTSDGSAEWVMRDSAAQGELNALTLKNNADIKATAYRNEADLDRYRAGNDQIAGYMGATSGAVSGAKQLLSEGTFD